MPIRPENKGKYPKDWPEISKRIRFDRAGNKCEWCGVRNRAFGYRDEDGRFHEVEGMEAEIMAMDGEGIQIGLTVAHLNHDPTDCRDENLAALCQKCHNSYDAAERARGKWERRHKDQLLLFPRKEGGE